jgi:hypothetical protein
MNTRNQQPNRSSSTRPSSAPSNGSAGRPSLELSATPPDETDAATAAYMNVFTVEEYESHGKAGKRWIKVGAAFPHKEGPGFSIELSAIPLDGRLVILPLDDSSDRASR